MYKIGNYINGNIVHSNSLDNLDIFDPSTGEVIGNINLSNNEDFNKVIKSSIQSQIDWSNITPLKRSRILSKFKILIEENIDELARLVSKEHGKTLEDAKGSVTRGLEVVVFLIY